MLNEDAMATDKLSEGIRKFAVDARKLEEMIAAQVADHTNGSTWSGVLLKGNRLQKNESVF